MNYYNKTKEYVVDLFTKSGDLRAIQHHEDTDGWIIKLKSDADEALRTAAISHDVDRGVYGDWKKGSMDPKELMKHQVQSSEIVEKFLRTINAEENFISRVKHLISSHEEGGDEDQNLLCDADALAFLEDKAMGNAKPQSKEKLEYVFNRIHSDKAKAIALKYYKEAMSTIN